MPDPTQRSVLVIGAQGFLGSFLARAFSRHGWRVTRGGRRPEPAGDFRLVDLDRPDTIRNACAEVDLVLSTVRHPGLNAERAVLVAGPTLLNLDDLPATPRARLKHDISQPAGLVVDRSGLYGVAMLALSDLLAQHPDADAVDYGFLASNAEAAGPSGRAIVHRLLAGSGRHPTTAVRLPPPFGACRAIVAGPDGESLARDVAGARAVRVLVSFTPGVVNRAMLGLNAIGLASRLPLGAFTFPRTAPPAEPSRQPTCHWVSVRRSAKVVASRCLVGAGDYRSSVATTLAFADALVDRPHAAPVRRGVFGVDELLSFAQMEPALHASGIETGALG